jgi:NTP pyrophosphatase (non-canonical NTP hydrolase)
MKKEDIVALILSERNKQDIKWGEQNHNIYKWLAILGEEVGEVNKAALEDKYDEVLAELIQIAAVSVAMIESLDRNRKK